MIQVCADAASRDTLLREQRALLDAATEFPDASRLLLLFDRPTMPLLETARAEDPEVRIMSVVNWILG